MPRSKKLNMGERHTKGSVGRPSSKIKSLVTKKVENTEDPEEQEELIIESKIEEFPEEIKKEDIVKIVNSLLSEQLKIKEENDKKNKEERKKTNKQQKELELEEIRKKLELDLSKYKEEVEGIILQKKIVDTKSQISEINQIRQRRFTSYLS